MIAAPLVQLLRRKLLTDALSLYAVQGLNYLSSLIVLPYVLRALGPAGFGSIVLAQALIGYAMILTDFGFNFTAARDISVARADPAAISRVYWTTMAAKGLLLCMSLGVVLATVAFVPSLRILWPVFLVCCLQLLGSVVFPQWYFQGLERLKEIALTQTIAKVVIAGITIALVRTPADLVLAAALASIPQLAGTVVAAAFGIRMAPALYRPRLADVGGALANSWHLFASGLSTTLYANANAFVLGLMCGPEEVAKYGIANKLVLALQGLVAPVGFAVFPRASLLFAERPGEGWRLMGRLVRVIAPAIALASIAMAALAPQILVLLGGAPYRSAASVMRIMALNPLLITALATPAHVIMANTGLTRQLWRTYAFVGLASLAPLPLLVARFAAEGAAASLVITQAVVAGILAVTVLRQFRGFDRAAQ